MLSTLVALGTASLAGIRIATILQFAGSSARFVERVTYLLFACYCFVVLFVSDRFFIAILGYLPMILFFGFECIAEYDRRQRPVMLLGGVGAILTLLSAAVQRVPPAMVGGWFNNNVAYHILQAFSLFILYFPSRELSKSYGEKIHNY